MSLHSAVRGEESELLRLQLSSRDFEDARDFIDAAKRHDASTIEYAALVMTAIVCYARPFTKNELDPNSTVASKLILDDPNSVLGPNIGLHNSVKRMRNKAVAHSESSHNPVQLVPVISGIGFLGRKWSLLEESIDIDVFRKIAETMRWYCINEIVALTAKEPASAERVHPTG